MVEGHKISEIWQLSCANGCCGEERGRWKLRRDHVLFLSLSLFELRNWRSLERGWNCDLWKGCFLIELAVGEIFYLFIFFWINRDRLATLSTYLWEFMMRNMNLSGLVCFCVFICFEDWEFFLKKISLLSCESEERVRFWTAASHLDNHSFISLLGTIYFVTDNFLSCIAVRGGEDYGDFLPQVDVQNAARLSTSSHPPLAILKKPIDTLQTIYILLSFYLPKYILY